MDVKVHQPGLLLYGRQLRDSALDSRVGVNFNQPLINTFAYVCTELINLQLKSSKANLVHVDRLIGPGCGEMKALQDIARALVVNSEFALVKERASQRVTVPATEKRVKLSIRGYVHLISLQQKSFVPGDKASL